MKVELHLNYDKESHKSESYQAVVKEKVYSPLKPLILHVDFQEILLGEEITTVLKLKLEGRAKGEEVGGIPELQISELEIRARVEDIPPFISIDITPLEIGDTFTIRDLKEKYPKLRILEEDTSPIVIISPPEKPEEEEIKEEVVKEPEVIRERKMEYE
jgi:large subunit ribosomal protein L25